MPSQTRGAWSCRVVEAGCLHIRSSRRDLLPAGLSATGACKLFGPTSVPKLKASESSVLHRDLLELRWRVPDEMIDNMHPPHTCRCLSDLTIGVVGVGVGVRVSDAE